MATTSRCRGHTSMEPFQQHRGVVTTTSRCLFAGSQKTGNQIITIYIFLLADVFCSSKSSQKFGMAVASPRLFHGIIALRPQPGSTISGKLYGQFVSWKSERETAENDRAQKKLQPTSRLKPYCSNKQHKLFRFDTAKIRQKSEISKSYRQETFDFNLR